MADRMTGFIKEHYLVPAPMNYRAVSKFMWAAMDDCIHTHDMPQVKFKWTEADYERAIALKAQGLTYKETARYLSPTLTPQNVSSAQKKYSSPNSSRLLFDGISTGSEEYLALLKPLMWRSICTGAALRILSRDYNEDCAFPLVRAFTLFLESHRDDDLTEPGFSGESKEPGDMNDAYQANISEFVRWVKQKAPMVNKVRVEVNDSLVAENDHDGHFSYLVPQLYRLGTRIEYTCNNGRIAPEASQLNEIRGLVHISYLGNDAWNQFMHLARQNVQTLQYLNLDSRGFGDVAGLIQDPDGSYVTYPCLRTLELRGLPINDKRSLPNFPGAAPFPLLRCLAVRLRYPFGDDVLFRGNSATLESLALRMDRLTVAMLRHDGVFTPTSHPKLRCVNLERLDRIVPKPFATYAEVVRYALSVGPGAPVRIMDGVLSSYNLLRALSLPDDYSSIRVLSIPSTDLDIWQAISLIKALPLLSDLHSRFPSIGPMPNGTTRAKLSEYMVSTYAPVGKRFRCWHIGRYAGNVECMILLALACPNFDYVAMDQEERKPFMKDLKMFIGLDRFKPYAPRLCRLLFNGGQNC
ncbi:hypothetical protein H4R27_004987 [Coemansia aciculifera]|nr:hypothetical protein H4R27_004987 [Coemansia aciculifera]